MRGSAVFVLVAFAVLLPQMGAQAAVVAAVATMFAEVLPLRLDDNLTVPLTCGAVLWAMASLPA